MEVLEVAAVMAANPPLEELSAESKPPLVYIMATDQRDRLTPDGRTVSEALMLLCRINQFTSFQ